jgi:hypothetical protein
MLKIINGPQKKEKMSQEDKRRNTDLKTNVKYLKECQIVNHFQKMNLGETISLGCEGPKNNMSQYRMKTSASYDPVLWKAKNIENVVKKGGNFLSKEDVGKRLKAWERTTIVRKRSEK